MSKLKKKLTFETTFGLYVVDELLGEGGAGRVYGGVGLEGANIALKVLTEDRTSADKRRRFKNEIAFLTRNKHPNVVTVIDYGISRSSDVNGPFYVMPQYHGNLRGLMREGIAPERALPLFSQILDGVEAAHLHNVVHRDLKPENILYNRDLSRLAVADFGIARFTEELLATLVETAPAQRLANFQYAAPEQRTPGQIVARPADIYALGLILNEMFTGVVPHGTQYRLIENVSKEYGFLDPIVASMLSQGPPERPASIADVKGLIQRYQAEAVSLQRLSSVDGAVISSKEIDEPLAHEPPRLVHADWNRGLVTLTMDRPVTPDWIAALRQMGSFAAVLGKGPEMFTFSGNKASIDAREHEVQSVIDHFKSWLPQATRTLKHLLEQHLQRQEAQRREKLRLDREEQEQRLRVLRSVKI